MLTAGVLLVAGGLFMGSVAWRLWFPIERTTWPLSLTVHSLISAVLALVAFAMILRELMGR